MTREEEIRRGHEAARILAEPLLVEAFAALDARYLAEWRATPVRDAEGRELIWQMTRALHAMRDHLTTLVETGMLATIQAEKEGNTNAR